MFSYTLDNKRYHTLNYYYKNKYHKKVFKVSLNQGLSCPNKKNGYGCIYCSNESGDFGGNKNDSLKVQFSKIKEMMENKWPDAYYIAYFQAGTNTYGDINTLKKNFLEVLSYKNVIGIDIATRSDSISDEMYDFLEELNKKTDLTMEIGLQSMHDKTLKSINRGHDLDNFIKCINELKKRKIKVVVHIINGLMNETKEDMINTVKFLNQLGIFGIKIHMLFISHNTPLEKIYNKNKFHILTKEEYIDIVTEQLSYLDPKIVICRITGDPNKNDLIEPTWLLKKFVVLNDIDKEMIKKNYYQGCNIK